VLFALPASSSREIAGYRKAMLESTQMQKTCLEIFSSEQKESFGKVWSLLCL
jgi:hypothetical protein